MKVTLTRQQANALRSAAAALLEGKSPYDNGAYRAVDLERAASLLDAAMESRDVIFLVPAPADRPPRGAVSHLDPADIEPVFHDMKVGYGWKEGAELRCDKAIAEAVAAATEAK